MTFGSFVLISYVVFVLLMARRMRQLGIQVFDFVVFAVNFGAIVWLLFLFWLMSSDDIAGQGLRASNNSWIPWICLLLAVMLIPSTIFCAVRGARSRRNDSMPEDLRAGIEAARKGYPQAILTLIIGASWLIFIGSKTFLYLHSHLLPIILGIGASIGFGWVVVALVGRSRRHGGVAT